MKTRKIFAKTASAAGLMPMLIFLTLPLTIQAQFAYTTNNGGITITKYTASGGAVTIPPKIKGLPVVSIGDNAFENCRQLTRCFIPDSVTNIGDHAFENCLNLGSIVMPDSVASIGDSAFTGCWSLTSVRIPPKVTTIGERTFIGCSKLTSITIPPGVTSIGRGAFLGCDKLASVTIPNGVTDIGEQAFGACDNLTAIIAGTQNPVYSSKDGILYNKNQTTLVTCPNGKASVSIPGGVTSIGQRAFSQCTKLTSITIPNGVINIGGVAFQECRKLTSVTIPNSVIKIEGLAFLGCDNLAVINIGAQNPAYSSMGGALYNKNQTTLVCCLPGAHSVVIPASVTYIEQNAFSGCSKLTSIYFQGNAPSLHPNNSFLHDSKTTVYYIQGTAGWDATFAGRPTAPWKP